MQANFPWFPVCQDGPFLDLAKVIFWKSTSSPAPCFSPRPYPMGSCQADPWVRPKSAPMMCALVYSHFRVGIWSCWLPRNSNEGFTCNAVLLAFPYLCVYEGGPPSALLLWLWGPSSSYHPADFGGQPGSTTSSLGCWLSSPYQVH